MQYAFDFHFHSCLSPCGSDDNTPGNLAGMCALAGLDIVALTDHNTCGNCAAFCAACAEHGLLALPGMELTTLEEVHIICLLPDLTAAAAFSAYVGEHLPHIPNNRRIFGTQIYMDESDTALGEETKMLAGATDIGVYDAYALAATYGGVAWPAHIDRPSFSLLSNLGLWDSSLGFSFAELSHACPPDFLNRPDLKGVHTITASDAHYLEQVADSCQTLELPKKNAEALFDWLRTPDFLKYVLKKA